MKNQTSRMLFMFTSMGFVLLGIGCSPGPSPNNQSNSNQNTSSQISSSNKTTPTPLTCVLSEEELVKALPKELEDQYNKNFTVSVAGDKLIFKGNIYGDGRVLQQLFNNFDKFRGKDCINVVSFQGNTENDKFYWSPTANCPTRVPALSCNVRNLVKLSRIKYQLNHNLFFEYNKGNDGVLEFWGFVGDKPNSGQFKSLFAQLQNDMNNECITKITFDAGSNKTDQEILDAGFEWMLCQPPNCECAAECRAVCPCDGPTPDA